MGYLVIYGCGQRNMVIPPHLGMFVPHLRKEWSSLNVERLSQG